MATDIEAQQRLFFSNQSKYGFGLVTPLVGFFSPSQLEEGLMQAAPAHEDCLELPSERGPEVDTIEGSSTSVSTGTSLPYLPPEIQIQIINHYSEVSDKRFCGFCHMFQLASACRVSKLWNYYALKKLYSSINLEISTPCENHYHLSSKLLQMEKRIPLLVRSLESQPRLADMVRRIQFPSGGSDATAPGALAYWVTCGLEKRWLPSLIRACGNLEAVEGLEDILSQLFNGEHWCPDSDGEEEEHGYLAQALFEKTTLKEWTWGRGHLRKLGERVVGNYQSFSDCHKNWSNLQHLSVIGLSTVTPPLIITACEQLPSLKELSIGFRDSLKNEMPRNQFTSTLLDLLPETIQKVHFVDKATSVSMETIIDWTDMMISTKISQAQPHYEPVCEITETEHASRSLTSRKEVSFKVDEENYSKFWDMYTERQHSRYSRVETLKHNTTTLTSITIYF